MYDYSTGTPPWSKYAEYIKAIDIKEGVTSIGNLAFCGYLSPEGSSGIDSISLKEDMKQCFYLHVSEVH